MFSARMRKQSSGVAANGDVRVCGLGERGRGQVRFSFSMTRWPQWRQSSVCWFQGITQHSVRGAGIFFAMVTCKSDES